MKILWKPYCNHTAIILQAWIQDVNENALFAFSLRFFRPNLTDVSEEHGERFHQDIQVMEKRYQGRWDDAMMEDYVWTLIREDKQIYKRKCRLSVHF